MTAINLFEVGDVADKGFPGIQRIIDETRKQVTI